MKIVKAFGAVLILLVLFVPILELSVNQRAMGQTVLTSSAAPLPANAGVGPNILLQIPYCFSPANCVAIGR
ncbi:MAG: hypothetical protein HKL80_09905 [Acidimicrobiales bacterium]|nr:hypothetical protein [Acidimicrobiales bacterium]